MLVAAGSERGRGRTRSSFQTLSAVKAMLGVSSRPMRSGLVNAQKLTSTHCEDEVRA